MDSSRWGRRLRLALDRASARFSASQCSAQYAATPRAFPASPSLNSRRRGQVLQTLRMLGRAGWRRSAGRRNVLSCSTLLPQIAQFPPLGSTPFLLLCCLTSSLRLVQFLQYAPWARVPSSRHRPLKYQCSRPTSTGSKGYSLPQSGHLANLLSFTWKILGESSTAPSVLQQSVFGTAKWTFRASKTLLPLLYTR